MIIQVLSLGKYYGKFGFLNFVKSEQKNYYLYSADPRRDNILNAFNKTIGNLNEHITIKTNDGSLLDVSIVIKRPNNLTQFPSIQYHTISFIHYHTNFQSNYTKKL